MLHWWALIRKDPRGFHWLMVTAHNNILFVIQSQWQLSIIAVVSISISRKNTSRLVSVLSVRPTTTHTCLSLCYQYGMCLCIILTCIKLYCWALQTSYNNFIYLDSIIIFSLSANKLKPQVHIFDASKYLLGNWKETCMYNNYGEVIDVTKSKRSSNEISLFHIWLLIIIVNWPITYTILRVFSLLSLIPRHWLLSPHCSTNFTRRLFR